MSPPHSRRASSQLPVRQERPTSSRFRDALVEDLTIRRPAGLAIDTTEAVARLAQVEATAAQGLGFFARLRQQTRDLRRSLTFTEDGGTETEDDGDADMIEAPRRSPVRSETTARRSPFRRYPSQSSRIGPSTLSSRVQSGRISRPVSYSGRPRSEIYNYREQLSPAERPPPRTWRQYNTHRLSPVFEDGQTRNQGSPSSSDENGITVSYPYTSYPASRYDRIDPRTGFACPPPWVRFKYNREGRVVIKGDFEDWEGLEDLLPKHPWAGKAGRFGNVCFADGRVCVSSAEEAPRAGRARRVPVPDWAVRLGHGEVE